jgi:predicted secreted Zn-dependent protease
MMTGRISFAAFLILSIVAGHSSSAYGDTVISKSITYFSVGGRTAEELDKALSERGPMMNSTGARHPGATRIKFGGTVTYVKHGNRCAVGSAKVTLSTRLILPRWKNRRTANRDLALVWDTLASDIKRHEERHAEIARNHARKLEKDFLALKPEADCERMQARVARLSETAIQQHDRDQARFDRTEAANFDATVEKRVKCESLGIGKTCASTAYHW